MEKLYLPLISGNLGAFTLVSSNRKLDGYAPRSHSIIQSTKGHFKVDGQRSPVDTISSRLSSTNRTIKAHQQLMMHLIDFNEELSLIQFAKSIYL